jgi:glutamine synthetase
MFSDYSYKRLNIAFWAPITVSYGFESRTAAIRIITPPVASPKSTRIEIRVPGADVNTYLVLAAINACGFYGIDKKLELGKEVDPLDFELLPKTLREAVEVMKGDSLARTVLGNAFVDHYVATREHELRLWDLTVTDYELKRYMETV